MSQIDDHSRTRETRRPGCAIWDVYVNGEHRGSVWRAGDVWEARGPDDRVLIGVYASRGGASKPLTENEAEQ